MLDPCKLFHQHIRIVSDSLDLLFQRSFAQSRAEKEQYHGKQMQGRKLAVNLKTHNQNAPKGVADWKWKKRARFFPACAPIMLGGWGRLRSPRRTWRWKKNGKREGASLRSHKTHARKRWKKKRNPKATTRTLAEKWGYRQMWTLKMCPLLET